MCLNENDKVELANLIVDLLDKYEKNSDDKIEDNAIQDYNNKNTYRRYNDVNRILRKIERYNPGIFRTMCRYGIPYPVARRLCRRIIRLTLMYYND